MGLLDGLVGQVVGSALGGGNQGQGNNPLGAILASLGGSGAGGGQNKALLGAVMAMVQQQGGIGAVLGKFRSSGLAQQADSWVSTGANMPISADQISKVLGNGAIGGLASQLGMQPQQAGGALANMLPELINQLTPNGSLPDNHSDLLSQGMKMLQGLSR